MKILVLYSGSRSIEKEAQKLGHETFSVDWTNYEGTDLQIDIGILKLSDIPFIPDAIWVSTDCTTYSIAACSTHRNPNKTARSDYAKQCDKTNKHWIGLIKQWQKINPDLIYWIENPRGILRHMDFMQEFTRYTIWYCQYGDDRAKPTDIWTNSKVWTPRPVCRNYKYNKQTGEIIDKHCHHESARRGATTGTQGRKGSYERSKIPSELCKEILLTL